MRILYKANLILVVIFLLGCMPKWHDTTIDQQVPNNLTKRNYLKGIDDILRHDLSEVVSSVYVWNENKGKHQRLQQIKIKDFTPAVKIFTDKPQPIYHSIVSNEISGHYTVFASLASMGNKKKAEVLVEDLAYALIPDDKTPYEQLIEIAEKHGDKELLWIYGAQLTSITTSYYSENSDEGKIVGPAFSVGGKVYVSDTKVVKSYVIDVSVRELTKQYVDIMKTILKVNADLGFARKLSRLSRDEQERLLQEQRSSTMVYGITLTDDSIRFPLSVKEAEERQANAYKKLKETEKAVAISNKIISIVIF